MASSSASKPVIPDAARQVVQLNAGVVSVHSRHDGSDQPAVRPQTRADLSRRRPERGLRVQTTRGITQEAGSL